MSQLLLLRGAKQLLTLRGAPNVRRGADSADLAVIPDGSILIRDGKIASVGSTRRLENMKEVRGALEVPVYGCVVMPGLVDPGIRLSLADHSKNQLNPKRKRPNQFYSDAIALLRSCLQHGTLTAGIKAAPGPGMSGSDLSALRQLARIGNNPVAMVRTWCPGRGSGSTYPPPNSIAGTLATICKHKLAAVMELRGDTDHTNDSEVIEAANSAQINLGVDWEGGPASQLEHLLRATSPAGVFCPTHLSIEECAVLTRSNSTAIFAASHNLLEAKPGGSVLDLLAGGGGVALASGYDSEGEKNFNMQWAVALAVMRLRLSVEQALVAATINAAYALHCGDEVGSLEVDKRADIVVLNLDDYREIPRRLGVNHVGMVIRNGNIAINRSRGRAGAA